jgi:ATP-dependent Lhr-like helicase
VDDLVAAPVSGTERAAAWAEQLLERQGVVTRGGVAAEGVAGGFTGLYPVLNRLEEVGRVRRGYFVEGLGGAQFALPGAIDRLRAQGGPPVVALASTDPANPYGAMLDWPVVEAGRIGRIAGTYVVLVEGRLGAYLDGRKLRTFEAAHDDAIHPAVAALVEVGRRHRRFTIETVDGNPAAGGRWGAALTEHGFSPALRGLTLRL